MKYLKKLPIVCPQCGIEITLLSSCNKVPSRSTNPLDLRKSKVIGMEYYKIVGIYKDLPGPMRGVFSRYIGPGPGEPVNL
jgi:hypothetical protein